MNVASLFDGCACGRAALERAGIPVTNYYASEIDKYSMKISKLRWPDIVHIGDVRGVTLNSFPFIPDLLIGGSPCQGFSFAGKRLNMKDPRSKLVFKYIHLLRKIFAVNPKIKFLLENVEMDLKSEQIISAMLGKSIGLKGVIPVKRNSALVSAQNRVRLYWSNLGPRDEDVQMYWKPLIPPPLDRGILLKDILEDGYVDREKSYCIDANYAKGGGHGKLPDEIPQATGIRKLCNVNPSGNGMNGNVFDIEGKAPTVTTNKGEGSKVGWYER